MKRFRKSNRDWKKETPSMIVYRGTTGELFGSDKD
jgi:hypothetical protein